MRSLLSALPLATLCYYHDFYCHLRSLRSHLGSRPVGRGPPASLLGLIGRWHREDRSCPDARRKEGAREEEGRATAAAPEEGGRATAAAPPSSKVQGHPSNSIGDNRVGDTSDATRVGDMTPAALPLPSVLPQSPLEDPGSCQRGAHPQTRNRRLSSGARQSKKLTRTYVYICAYVCI